MTFTVNSDPNLEAITPSLNPFWKRLRLAPLLVHRVFPFVSSAQIVPSVIIGKIIAMINLNGWLLACHPLPDNPMDRPHRVVKTDEERPFLSDATCLLSGRLIEDVATSDEVDEMVVRSLPPRQESRAWIIIEALAKIDLIWQKFHSRRVLSQHRWSEAARSWRGVCCFARFNDVLGA